jgi:hypothetical protein
MSSGQPSIAWWTGQAGGDCLQGIMHGGGPWKDPTYYAHTFRLMLESFDSEHLAKFICFGSWISLQMVPGSLFRKAFEEVIKIKEELINVIPEDLRSVVQHPRRILYKELKHDSSSVVRYIKTLETLSKDDVDIEDCWNVVMMGPSGSGKATIINQLFNQNVCTSRSSSAPKIEILQGKFKDLKVNIFNVSGLCDSRLEDFEIRSFVNGAIKGEFRDQVDE